MLSYYGIGGESNRKKVAELFKRPTTWGDFCTLISLNNCSTASDTAVRAPIDDDEAGKYYVDGLFRGYFRATEKNVCSDANPNCTGHIANVPCSWGIYSVAQAVSLYYANIMENVLVLGKYTMNSNPSLFILLNSYTYYIYKPIMKYHLGIAVESDGPGEANGSYSYGSMLEIYAAANATGSHVIMVCHIITQYAENILCLNAITLSFVSCFR